MTVSEIFSHLPPGQSEDIFGFLHQQDKGAYQACLELLARRRKLRPIFIERKPRVERYEWMREALSRKPNEDAALEILQAWLFGRYGQMICDFLDSLNIPHNGKGILDALPGEPSSEELKKAVDQLLANYPAAAVAIYLQLFAMMDIAAGWEGLQKMLATDPRLSFIMPALQAP
jgi:hypothetical protein